MKPIKEKPAVQEQSIVEIIQPIVINEIFTSNILLNPLEKSPHVGLISSINLRSKDSSSEIVSIQLQGIDVKAGINARIMEHDHLDQNLDEIIIIDSNSVYPGLGEKTGTIAGFDYYYVPAGTKHGSDSICAKGRWISIKINSRANHL